MCGSPRALGRWYLGSLLALVADKLFALLSTSGAISALARESFGCWAPLPEGSWCHPKTGMGLCAADGTLCHHHTLRQGCSCSHPAVRIGHGTPSAVSTQSQALPDQAITQSLGNSPRLFASSCSAGVAIPWHGKAKAWTIWRGQHGMAWGALAAKGVTALGRDRGVQVPAGSGKDVLGRHQLSPRGAAGSKSLIPLASTPLPAGLNPEAQPGWRSHGWDP